VLAFGFTEKCQFVAKTDWHSVILGRDDTHIPDWLYIMVLYIIFTVFKKLQILGQNPRVLAFGFTEKRKFVAKTDQNSVFFGRDPHIPYRLYIMVLWISFDGFLEFSNLAQNLKVLAFGFNEKRHFVAKTDRNYVFLGRDPRIPDRLYILVLYISFYGF
jgi:hypothetical protein